MVRVRGVAALAALALLCAGCTGVSTRDDEARAIERTVRAMPGVSDVDLTYDNGVLEGTRFELRVQMEGASDAQVGAVAAKIDELRSDDFAGHDQLVEIEVARSATISGRRSDLPDDVAVTAARLQRIRTQVPDGTIDWSAGSETSGVAIQVFDTTHPAAALDSVLAEFEGTGVVEIRISAVHDVEAASWWIRGPFTRAEKARFDQQVAAAAPAVVDYIDINNGHLDQLNVRIADPATAYDDVVRVIRAVDAGPQQPVRLLWSLRGDPGAHNEPRWSGSALVGQCPSSEKTEALTPDAFAIQERIRAEFQTCH